MATKDKNRLRLAAKPPQARERRAERREQPDRRGAPPAAFKPDALTMDQARQKWPDAVPWPLPGPVHGRAGFATMTGWAGQEYVGGEKTPEEILGQGMNSFMVLVAQVRLLQHGEIAQETTIATHAEWGNFHLRAVIEPSGYLFGIVDDENQVLGAPEWYSEEDAKTAWNEWLDVINS